MGGHTLSLDLRSVSIISGERIEAVEGFSGGHLQQMCFLRGGDISWHVRHYTNKSWRFALTQRHLCCREEVDGADSDVSKAVLWQSYGLCGPTGSGGKRLGERFNDAL